MLRSFFRNRRSGGTTLAVGGIVALITFFLLGALLSPTENTHNLPVALVNSDQGATAGPQQLNFGKEIVNRVTGPQQTDTLKWTVLDNRQQALDGVRKRKYYAALVIPADYSASLVAITNQSGQKSAQLEFVTNPVGPIIGIQTVQGALSGIVSNLSKATGEQLAKQMEQTHAALTLPAATFLSNPVQLVTVPVATIGEHSGRGISVFFLAILLTVAGILAAMIPDQAIQHIAQDRRKNDQQVSEWVIFGARTVLYAIAGLSAVIGMLLICWAVNMDVPDWGVLFLFATLYIWTVSAIVLLCQSGIGQAGIGIATLLLILLSLPSSGGLFPVESLPAIWQWLNAVVPMRFMVDGIRSVLFLDREMDNGLGVALIVLASYSVGALLLSGLVVWLKVRVSQKKVSQPQSSRYLAV
jgi:YhgE/Pip-like protein